jgi:hypothetical protein
MTPIKILFKQALKIMDQKPVGLIARFSKNIISKLFILRTYFQVCEKPCSRSTLPIGK